MGNVEKLERSTKGMEDAVAMFEKQAKAKYMNIDREENAPVGYWYCDGETNAAFYWFMSGISYGKLISR